MRNLAPTKTNLLKLKEELSFAELGKDLLDQKRGILVTELLALVDQAVSYEKSVKEALAKAFETLEDAVLAIGKLQVLSLSGAVNMDASIQLGQRKVMGVSLPVVETTFTDRAPYFSALGADFRVDLAVKGFREALGLWAVSRSSRCRSPGWRRKPTKPSARSTLSKRSPSPSWRRRFPISPADWKRANGIYSYL
jgi:V/A-type H+-transporting ATPase subunit D